MIDLVKRLLDGICGPDVNCHDCDLHREAAEAIEAQAAEIERLRGALRELHESVPEEGK